MAKKTDNLADELASLKKPEAEVESTTESNDAQAEIQRLRAELEAAKLERDEWQQVAESAQAENLDAEPEEVDEDAALYYEGIKHPDYRLMSIYVPFNAKGVSKHNGYDPEFAESFVYTIVKVGHQLPGSDYHRFDEFRIRLDSRVIAPAFVANALGDRCDAQEYFGE